MRKLTVALAVAAGLVTVPAFAEGDFKFQIGARKAHMAMIGFNMGTLGTMAQGKMDYDAAAASAAANNIAALASIDITSMYPAGSDNVAHAGETRLKPEALSDMAGFKAKYADLGAAAQAMAAAAGGGLESLQGAMGALGGACGACHKAYRGPAN